MNQDATPFVVGIDLGTTNSAVAYVDLREARPRLRLFEVPQVVAPGEVAPRETLPSFVYFEDARAVVGTYAREQGALVPAQQISSAKSWLSHPAVDRTARFLPWGSESPLMSPVDASAAVLRHIREAWNQVFAGGTPAPPEPDLRLEQQEIILTVPASFDQEARALTLQAAREAGFERLRLLEEPLAAFYAWISRHGVRKKGKGAFKDGDLVLVCDVGGGTSDFTLIRVGTENGGPAFERAAVGEHLLLGGDNLDLALARRLEQKLGDRALTLVQRLALRRTASAAKERLLSEPSLDKVPIAVLGSGRALVGGSMATDLTRADVEQELAQGFLPLVDAGARPARERRAALRELGLPYAEDPAITRHLAAFLEQAAEALRAASRSEAAEGRSQARPDAILFNGGFFTPAVARRRVLDNLRSWFGDEPGWKPVVLENPAPAAAVALGAAYYGLVLQRGGLRVRAGSSRTYYMDVGAPGGEVMCILPRGTEEGTTFVLADREFAVMTNRPVSFPLFSSPVRTDELGALVVLGGEEVHAHAALATVLRYGKKSRQVELAVTLAVTFTETGMLEVACASKSSEHRWRLQFQLRGEREDVGGADVGPGPDVGRGLSDAAQRQDVTLADADASGQADAESLVPGDRLGEAREAIRATFAGDESAVGPTALPSHLEATLGFGRHAWPLSAIRPLADTLLDAAAGRKQGPNFEARWLNLLGFCLRPGFGAHLDDWRVGRTRGIYVEGLTFAKDLQCQVEWVVLWQRVAGGLRAGQQRELYQRHATLLDVRAGKRAPRLNPQIQREAWRLLASLEQLSAAERTKLGEVLLDRLEKDPDNSSYLWAVGRFGARMPAHGPVTSVVPPDRAERWVERLFSLRTFTGETAAAVAQIAGRSDDPLRDVAEAARSRAAARLTEAGYDREAEALREFQPPAARDALRMFGETLPVGLRLRASGGPPGARPPLRGRGVAR